MERQTQDVRAVLAHEYGYLDHKHDMGHSPRPHGFEKEYNAGYNSWKTVIERRREIMPVTYAEPCNWGWY